MTASRRVRLLDVPIDLVDMAGTVELVREHVEHGRPGAHLGVSLLNARARAFYAHLGFRELTRTGSGDDACVYMGLKLRD